MTRFVLFLRAAVVTLLRMLAALSGVCGLLITLALAPAVRGDSPNAINAAQHAAVNWIVGWGLATLLLVLALAFAADWVAGTGSGEPTLTASH